MLRGAASYLWGNSTKQNNENKTDVNENNENKDINNNTISKLTPNTNTNRYLHLSQFIPATQPTNTKSTWHIPSLPSTSLIKHFSTSKSSTTSNNPSITVSFMQRTKANTTATKNTIDINEQKSPITLITPPSQTTSSIDQITPPSPTTPSITTKNNPKFKYRLSATDTIAFLFEDDCTHNSHQQTNNSPKSTDTFYYICANRMCKKSVFDIYPYLKSPEKVPQYLLLNIDHASIDDKSITIPIRNLSKHQRIQYFINGLQGLTNIERKGLHSLFTFIIDDRMSRKMQHELYLGDVVLSYFSANSPTNPDPIGCWKKWIAYRIDMHNILCNENVNDECRDIYEFFETGICNIGFDDEQRPVWFLSSEKFNDRFSAEVVTKATILWMCSMMWNLKTNEFDLFSLRKGVVGYINLSHFSFNAMPWGTVKMIKHAVLSFPFYNVKLISVNTPTIIYLAKQMVMKIVAPTAMEKWVDLGDPELYFDGYASRYKTPVDAGGTLKVTGLQWIIDRGYLDYIP